jgi:GntR family negative regulator for fad regulon and positive regulator of fabA
MKKLRDYLKRNRGKHPDQPLRPAQFTEHTLIQSILNGTYPPGSVLPSERSLSEILGVTRPTIREALQRLAGEGWVTIRHGKATEINDYWKSGGLRLLGTMAKYGEFLPESFIVHLLELRVILSPPIARYAVERAPSVIADHLSHTRELDNDAEAFTGFDWKLQVLMAHHSGNPVYPMILNDFTSIFMTMGVIYFSREDARKSSLSFYDSLMRAIDQDGESVERVVRAAMEKSIEIWKNLRKPQ